MQESFIRLFKACYKENPTVNSFQNAGPGNSFYSVELRSCLVGDKENLLDLGQFSPGDILLQCCSVPQLRFPVIYLFFHSSFFMSWLLTLVTCWLFSVFAEMPGVSRRERDMGFRSLYSHFWSAFCKWEVLSYWFKLFQSLFSRWSRDAYKSGFVAGSLGNKFRWCRLGSQSRTDPL